MTFKNTIFFLFSIALLLVGCKKTASNSVAKDKKNIVKYANGFSIYENELYSKLIIHRGFLGDNTANEYYLFPKNVKIPDSLKNKQIIFTPISKIIVTSTTHIPMLEAIEEEKSLIGFPNTQYISSAKTRHLIEIGKIKELGNEQSLNLEMLLNLKPDVLIGFGVEQPLKMYDNIAKMGIPVIMNSDWVEELALGRAEWIKLFGLLYGKSKQADLIFSSIETNYLQLKAVALKSKKKPSVMSGSLFQDTWNTPAGESFFAQMLQDAQADYVWKTTKGTGSLSLNYEKVFANCKDAAFWIAPGDFINYNQIVENHHLNKNFKSFQNQNIYTYAHQKNKYGGFYFFEVSPLRPDWVLSDLINIFHPDLLQEKKLYFFEKIKQ